MSRSSPDSREQLAEKRKRQASLFFLLFLFSAITENHFRIISVSREKRKETKKGTRKLFRSALRDRAPSL